MSVVYDLVYLFALLLSSPIWIYRLLSTGKWRTDWPARFGRCNITPDPQNRPTLLIHAVSVGEVNAIRLLVDRLVEKTSGGWRIIISTTTDTGTKRARELFEPKHTVVRYPLDFSWSVRRFLNAVRPDMIALVELEVWPNFVKLCDQRRIPVCVVNGRLSERSYRRYRLITPLLRPTFRRITAAVQTHEYAERFTGLGVPRDRVHVLDTMKWDTAQVLDPPRAGPSERAGPSRPRHSPQIPGAEDLARAMGIDTSGSRPIIVAGSTAPGENELLIDTCPPNAQLILAPRKPEWFDDAARLSPGMVRRTRHPDGKTRPIDGQQFFLLDTIGELRKAYALADVVIVGRSFVKLYGSDPMEPIALGKPTIIGPNYKDFADIVAALNAGAGIVITDNPARAITELLANPVRAAELAERGRRVILSRQGATDRHVGLLIQLMPTGAKNHRAS